MKEECQHVKANGNTCQSPPLKNEDFCYFHLAARDRIRRQRIAAQRKLPLQIPILEDHESIQLTITDVVNAMLADRIDYKKAALALYALQTAAMNVKHTTFDEADNNFQKYSPERDSGLPEIESEPAETLAEIDEKKKSATAASRVIAKIEASVERASRGALAPKKPPHRAASEETNALVHSALKHLKKRSTA